jgi:hypothetical protein
LNHWCTVQRRHIDKQEFPCSIMGGCYLYYRNRPNLASALLGAALRIACSLGLNREFSSGFDPHRSIERETNRRTWWSIHIINSWGSTTLGRLLMSDDNRVDVPRHMIDDHVSLQSSPIAVRSSENFPSLERCICHNPL